MPIHQTLPQAHDLIVRTLTRCNTAPANAAAVARALVAAEQAGQGGHGLRRLPSYAAQARSGKVKGHAKPTASQARPGVLSIDAQDGFAYPAIELGLDWLEGAARTQGIAVAAITRSHHCGVAGVTVGALAERGLVGLMFANTPAAMAPWGGRTPLFGTNPIAFAVPRQGTRAPVVIDVSLSKVARGKIMAAQQRGQPIPEGWALDADGEATTDPTAALRGTMIPMGEAKGTALALMVEMLAAGLVGARFGHEASSFFTADGPPPGVGQLIIAIDPAAFGNGNAARFERLAQAVETEPGARLPGTRRDTLRAEVAAAGIWIDDDLLAEIDAVTAEPCHGN
ncbi:Ldh family oxidoreductase [Paracoccus sediminis]|uniref:(2R)-3-sulfolactate dehydrogenase (NADP+) n=1 Tax=Paracoccus sediminis TaxID=1214787 RepID=A0A238WR96_9RHOB|nr:Ldh family oxidoreductase [Paracoccus sediminis]TBN50366.1 Ldh family oxidoreductase [Paracoccus sediminis]SNR48938.1 (2R)-3-sulfolactate dehydrogenase (NADP+) [Paracoccus sediminis]